MTIISTVAEGSRKVFSIPPYTGTPVVKVNGANVTFSEVGDSLISLTATPVVGSLVEIDYTPVNTVASSLAAALVRVVGMPVFGGTLTAVVAEGWAVTGYQWKRDGVNIAGATGSTYLLGAADIGKAVTVTVVGLTYTGQLTSVIGYTGAPLLRYATAFNKLASASVGTASGGERRTAGRIHRPIGSSAKKSLRVVANNFFLSNIDAITRPPTALTVLSCHFECNNISVPVSWGGNFTPSFPGGAEDIPSDELLPSQFGLSNFNRNRTAFLRYEVSVPEGGNIPVAEAVESLSTCRSFYVGAGSVSNVEGTGALVFTGDTSATFELPFLIIGEDVDTAADARAWVGIGDSIFAQGGPSSYFHQACAGNGTSYISGCTIAKSGSVSNMFVANSATLTKFLKYANGVVEEYGTNQVGSTLSTLQSNLQAVWALLWPNQSSHPLARPLVVLRPPLLNRTTDGTGATVHSAVWDAGGTVEQLNDWFLTQIGVTNRITAVASDLMDSPNLMRRGAGTKGVAGSDRYKWPNGAVDGQGLHPLILTASGVNGLGANLRVPMLAYA